jgi:hypothetical protein
MPLDSGEPEPSGLLDFTEFADEPEQVLSLETAEPDGTRIHLDDLGAMFDPLDNVDIEDFATQEELPTLPWKLEALLLESGTTVRTHLEPTLAVSVLERPGGSGRLAVTARLRMLDLPLDVAVVDGPSELLRLGRDLLGGRILIRVD